MAVIVLKTVQILCITMFFSKNVNCDQLEVQKMHDDFKIRKVAGCMTNCLNETATKTLQLCYNECSSKTILRNVTAIPQSSYNNLNVKLLCRDSTSIVLNITRNDSHNDHLMYIVRVQEHDNSYLTTYLSNHSIIKMENLTSKQLHNISVDAVNENYELLTDFVQISTLSTFYTVGDITDIALVGFVANANSSTLVDMIIEWKPAEDATCFYDIIWMSEARQDLIIPIEVRSPEELYRYKIPDLFFDHEYMVWIRSLNTEFHNIESTTNTTVKFKTPSCYKWQNNSYNNCKPIAPVIKNVTLVRVAKQKYDFYVEWEKPEFFPNNYTLEVVGDVNWGIKNVSGNATEAILNSINIISLEYTVELKAINNHESEMSVLVGHIEEGMGLMQIVQIILAIVGPLCIFAIGIAIVMLVFHRRAKLRRYVERCRYFEELEQKAPIDPNSNFDLKSKNIVDLEAFVILQKNIDCAVFSKDVMEIPRDNITVLEVLGEGAFGLVKRGILLQDDGTERDIAVKMLKDKHTIDDFKEFRREIEVMKAVGPHNNIVGIVGHCTRNVNELMLLTEYCSRGNLLNYLRAEWHRMYAQRLYTSLNNSECHTPSLVSQKTPENVFNFDTSFVDKSFKYKNVIENHNNITIDVSSDMNNDGEYTEGNYLNSGMKFNTTNLIINKLYDEYSHAHAKIASIQEIQCTNNCKCSVEVIRDSDGMPAMSNCTNCNDNELDYMDDDGSEVNIPIDDFSKAADETKQQNDDESCNDINTPEVSAKPKYKVKVNDCDCYKQLNGVGGVENGSINGSVRESCENILNSSEIVNCRRHCDSNLVQMDKRTIVVENDISRSNCDNNIKYKSKSINGTEYANNIIDDKGSVGLWKSSQASVAGGHEQTMKNGGQRECINYMDLVSFAKQIAKGMEFLSKNKVVHRDLAARNVLVCEDKTVKIADFGLSRDIYQDNIYKKIGTGKLPIKWLAIESMTHQVYTSHSDVWSYGILLYEIITLGANPYPSIPTNRLMKLLNSGYRMEKPPNCSQEIYDLMYSCWNSNPQSRPNFTEIFEKLEQQNWEVMKFEMPADRTRQKTSKSLTDESYLKPI